MGENQHHHMGVNVIWVFLYKKQARHDDVCLACVDERCVRSQQRVSSLRAWLGFWSLNFRNERKLSS